MPTYEVRLDNIRGEIFDRIEAGTVVNAAEQAAMRLYGIEATASRISGMMGSSSGLFQPRLLNVTRSFTIEVGNPIYLSELKEKA